MNNLSVKTALPISLWLLDPYYVDLAFHITSTQRTPAP